MRSQNDGRSPGRRHGGVPVRGRRAAAAGMIGAAFTLLLTATGPADAAHGPAPSQAKAPAQSSAVPLGEGRMGAGYAVDNPSAAATAAAAGTVTPMSSKGGVQGIDVSHYQGTINWRKVRAAGIQFAWIKATEGTTYRDPKFNENYTHAYNRKVIRGAYHFARPNASSAAAQAKYFAGHGGGWSKDGRTLPGLLDLEAGCYGKSVSGMRTWIKNFDATYKSKTGRHVVIYTSPSWWNTCTGGWGGRSGINPLADAHWTSAASPTLPHGFSTWRVWQYSSSGHVDGVSGNVDRDKFHGDRARLVKLANGS